MPTVTQTHRHTNTVLQIRKDAHTGTQSHRHTDIRTHSHTGTPIHAHTHTHTYRNAQTRRRTEAIDINTPRRRYALTQKHKDVRTQKRKNIDTQRHRSVRHKDAEAQKSSDPEAQKCTDAVSQKHRNRRSVARLLCNAIVIRLRRHMITQRPAHAQMLFVHHVCARGCSRRAFACMAGIMHLVVHFINFLICASAELRCILQL